jgi:hypothetical protein
MNPVISGYDELIMESFRQTFPDFNGAIKFWDGLRPKEDPLMTLTVMGFSALSPIRLHLPPGLRVSFCDDEQTAVCLLLGKLRKCDHCISSTRMDARTL